jgi:uncharacterized membrane protein
MNDRPGGPPWFSAIGYLLMLPLGIIIVLVTLYFIQAGGGYFPGELLLILLVAMLALFAVRALYWRSRRKYWRERMGRGQAYRILRERYARGEITKEQFEQMLRTLRESRNSGAQ